MRAARGSGKTMFCRLLQKHLERRGNKNVFYIDLLGTPDYASFVETFKFSTKTEEKKEGFKDLKEMSQQKSDATYYLIFDEVQLLYSEQFNLFWDTIKALLQRSYKDIKVFMVSSYTPNEVGSLNTPTQLKDAFSLQIPFLYCTPNEMEELNGYFNEHNPVNNFLQIGEELRDTIFKFTGGHIGLISQAYTNLFHHFKPSAPSKDGSAATLIPQEEIFYYFYSNDMQNKLSTYRTFDGLLHLKDTHKAALRKLFSTETDVLGVTDFEEEVLVHLLKIGVLDYTAVNSKQVTWSFPKMKDFMIPYLYGSNRRPTEDEWKEKSLNDFLLEALQRMSPKHIKAGIGKEQTSEYRLREQQVRVEFFRVATSMLPPSVYIASEMGKDANIPEQKRVDFYINDVHQWPVEFVVEDRDVIEHGGRSEKPGTEFEYKGRTHIMNGSYFNAKMKNWACVHFTTHNFQGSYKDIPGVWRVQFDENCLTATVDPWIRENKNDPGKRGERKRIALRGDFLTDPLYNPITLTLQLFDGNELKQTSLQNVPTTLAAFKDAVKHSLGLNKEQQIKMFIVQNGKRVELAEETQIFRLSNKELVDVRLADTRNSNFNTHR